LVGRGWPKVTSLATSASRRVEDRAAPRRRSKAPGHRHARSHDDAFGLLDQPPVLQGGLKLIGQPPLDLSGRTRRLQTDPACSRRCLVGPDSSRRTQSDRLDDQRNDQRQSDTRSDGKASCFLDGSKSRLGGLPHGGPLVRPRIPTDGSGCRRATSPGGPGRSGRGGLLRSLAQQ
jgi:hypothetical protein